jgi:hypothetical protein
MTGREDVPWLGPAFAVESRRDLVWSPEMRNWILALAVTICAAGPQTAFAENATSRQVRQPVEPSLLAAQLPALLQRLGGVLISKAHAAECTQEGETCTSNEQCCPGLECAGGPPATCSTED